MNQISVLSKDTIDKIAAGEVVERPASVVKELVENAIDAGANAVTVEIRDGGISLIRITDNGSGIPKEEVRAAFLRHATSKIRTVEDLLTSGTLGFRGEALSSIAAVCQVEMITKTAGSITGVRYIIEGGEEKSLEEIGAPEGTTFLVRNLFYHTPARKKFLKSAATEAGYVSDLMERMALSHPGISFKFINNRDTKLHTSGNCSLKDIIYGTYGRDIASNIVKLDAHSEGMHISGFIGKPAVSRGNRNFENYFVNGRYVKSVIIAKAIEEAYKPFMMSHRYPFTVISIDIDAAQVDVNVHPTKMEVRFAQQSEVYDRIYQAVKEALLGRELIPEFSIEQKLPAAKPAQPAKAAVDGRASGVFSQASAAEKSGGALSGTFGNEKDSSARSGISAVEKDSSPALAASEENQAGAGSAAPKASETASAQDAPASRPEADGPQPEAVSGRPAKAGYPEPFEKIRSQLIAEANSPYEVKYPQRTGTIRPVTGNVGYSAAEKGKQLELFEDKLLSEESVKKHKLVGQVFATYWIVEFEDKMYIIDQHAAHEKVLYERFMKNYHEKKQTSQMIAPPIIVTLTMQEETVLKEHMDQFAAVGFEIEHFGGREYSIRAVPGNLYGIADRTLFVEMLDSLSDISERASAQAVCEKIASMSCKAAVKGGHRLSTQEVDALISELLTLENPYNCPHGRPTIISMTKYELEKKFKRIV